MRRLERGATVGFIFILAFGPQGVKATPVRGYIETPAFEEHRVKVEGYETAYFIDVNEAAHDMMEKLCARRGHLQCKMKFIAPGPFYYMDYEHVSPTGPS